jgi:hypothetical protein
VKDYRHVAAPSISDLVTSPVRLVLPPCIQPDATASASGQPIATFQCRTAPEDKFGALKSTPPTFDVRRSYLRQLISLISTYNACQMCTSHSLLGGWTLLLILIFLVLVHGQQNCYFKEGTLASDDRPCTDLTTLDGADLPCCGINSTCLENRMCFNNATVPHLSKGSCTDWLWKSGNCPQFC